MQTVIIIIHLTIVIVLTGIVLVQPSEGSGLGGLGNISGFMTVRGVRNMLTRLTMVLATCFFISSIVLTVLQQAIPPQKDGTEVLDYLFEQQSETKEEEQLSIQPEHDNKITPNVIKPKISQEEVPN